MNTFCRWVNDDIASETNKMNSNLSNNIICVMHFIPCAVYVQMSSCLTFFLSCVAVSCSFSLWVSQYIIYTYLTSQELHCFFFTVSCSIKCWHSTIFNLCYSKRRDILERRATEIFFIEKCFLNLANSSRNHRLLVLSFRERGKSENTKTTTFSIKTAKLELALARISLLNVVTSTRITSRVERVTYKICMAIRCLFFMLAWLNISPYILVMYLCMYYYLSQRTKTSALQVNIRKE